MNAASDAPAPIEWAFSYSGTVGPSKDRSCQGCIACAFDPSLPPCIAHAGAVAALDAHVVAEDAEPWWIAARAMIAHELDALPLTAVVQIRARGDEHTPGNNRRNLAIEVSTIG